MARTLPTYDPQAVFQPSVGAVFFNELGTEPPTLEEIKAWVESGDIRQNIGTSWKGIGYTSIDELPGMDSETEGGEAMGVWEDPKFRTSPITTNDTLAVKPVQWSLEPIRHRFGKDAVLDGDKGIIKIPKVYVPVEVALIVIFLDGKNPLVVHYYRAVSAPDGAIEPDREQFLTLPVKYTILAAPGKSHSANILGYHLQTKDTDSDGIPDIIDKD